MKNLLTYISPDKDFNEEHKMAVRIQIDNSLELEWKKEDIILATNFYFEYKGVKSLILGDENYCKHFFPSTKIYVIDKLFDLGLIGNDLYWYHDFDCFQLSKFNAGEPDLQEGDMGLTNYGRVPRLCSASMFFKKSAKDIFKRLKEDIVKNKSGEESGIMALRLLDEYKNRIKHLNITYAFQKWNMAHCFVRANKPIRAVHFHLTPDKYDYFVRGNNRTNLFIIPTSLVNIFHEHGFKGDQNG